MVTPRLFGKHQRAAAGAVAEAATSVCVLKSGRGGREGLSEHAFPPFLLHSNDIDDWEPQQNFRWQKEPRGLAEGEGASVLLLCPQ